MTSEPRMLRLFVAIELDEAILQALGDLQTQLRKRGLDKLRWTRPEGIHLTLKFLGETPEERVPEIIEAVARGVGGHRRETLSLGKLGTFGGRSSPRVLWVDLTGDIDALAALQASIDGELAALGFEKEDRRFRPHLTLARVRPEIARDVAAAVADAMENVRSSRGELRADEVSLMQSTLGRGGAIYTRLSSAPLSD